MTTSDSNDTMPPMRSGEPRPPPVADGPGPILELVQGRWAGRIANLLVLAIVALACAYLLTPGLFAQRIPYGEESLGHFSNTVVKAGKDFDIPDDETTNRKREEARDAILPVYDFDLQVSKAASERVQAGFRLMQEAAREIEHRLQLAEPAEGRGEKLRKRREEDPAIQEAFAREFLGRREEWQRRIEAQIDDESFKALSDARFSRELAAEAATLVERASGTMIAEYREALTLSGAGGVVVRTRSGGAVSERVITDYRDIRDQTEVRAEVERWAGQLSAELTPGLRKALVTLAEREVRANLRYNRDETEARRRAAAESVKPVVIQLKKGEKIIGDGERIERRHLVIFDAIRSQSGGEENFSVRLGGGLFAIVIVVVVYGFARASMRRFRPTRKDALLGALTLVTQVGLVNLSITISDALHDKFTQLPAEALYFAAPFAAGAMLIRFVLTAEASIVFSMIFAGLSGVLLGNSLEFGLYALLGSLVASAKVAKAKDRAALFRAGLFVGVVNACAVVAFALLTHKAGWGTAAGAVAGFVGGALAVPILVMGITPLVEAAFGYTTDIKLLELANLNHPALKELIVQAPGTYHHSIIIGSLVEAAAEAIGANPLLARVCAYYHDIGKGKNPLYFSENQRGENRHDKLAPQMSSLIIKRHVTDGIELARQYKLPKSVADAIPQHHGTRLVGFFYHKATKELEGKPEVPGVDEGLYRYPGPKPQTRETALVMIADAVEASSRAMQDPTPPKLQGLVQKIINGIFADGQLDECDLTLRDLNEIARSFYRILGAIYHSRPDYPPQAIGAPPRPALAEVRDVRQGSEVPLPEEKKPAADAKKAQGN